MTSVHLLFSLIVFYEIILSIFAAIPSVHNRLPYHNISIPSSIQTSVKLSSWTEVLPQCTPNLAEPILKTFSVCNKCFLYSDGILSAEFLPPCPTSCCGQQSFNGATGHFTWCIDGCCHRAISLQTSPSLTQAQNKFILDTKVVILNDVTFKGKNSDKSCSVSLGRNRNCGPRCGSLLLGRIGSSNTIAATKDGHSFEDTPCSAPKTSESSAEDDVGKDIVGDTSSSDIGSSTGNVPSR